jgi:thiamine pyrophosphate-dependent acetolactate synthase large subunit-like protein
MKPCTKWADRVYNLKRIPEQVNNAFQKAMGGKAWPGVSRSPGDVLYAQNSRGADRLERSIR